MPQRGRRKRVGESTTPNPSIEDAPNKVWAVDFQFDGTTNGRPINIVSIVDEHARLGGLVDRSITGDDLIDELDRLAAHRGYPRCAAGAGEGALDLHHGDEQPKAASPAPRQVGGTT